MRFAHATEIASWNDLILANPDGGNVFQGAEFAEQKRLGGWTPRFIIAGKLAMTVLEKTVFGLGKLWYIPKGPGVTTPEILKPLLRDLNDFSREQGVFMVKIEPEFISAPSTLQQLSSLTLAKTTPIQPNFSTVLLDLSPDLDTIMASLNQKGRHAIRRAERDGVTAVAVESSDENCQLMYKLLADTAEGSFRIRHYEYYKTFWQRYAAAGLGQLFFAYVDGEVVAGAYAIAFGHKGTYKDGASIRERTVYGASHLLQWRVIEWMKSRGVIIHDLCGAPPSDQIKNEQHPHYGIGRFKTSFNKQVTDYVGAYDLAVRPLQYRIWAKLGERIALRIHNKRFNENYY
jgi:lipid II:glycine glycyltransferase (peptidoglycan interpeptide bridge formation enzyme)